MRTRKVTPSLGKPIGLKGCKTGVDRGCVLGVLRLRRRGRGG
jgi:hypothetical protein